MLDIRELAQQNLGRRRKRPRPPPKPQPPGQAQGPGLGPGLEGPGRQVLPPPKVANQVQQDLANKLAVANGAPPRVAPPPVLASGGSGTMRAGPPAAAASKPPPPSKPPSAAALANRGKPPPRKRLPQLGKAVQPAAQLVKICEAEPAVPSPVHAPPKAEGAKPRARRGPALSLDIEDSDAEPEPAGGTNDYSSIEVKTSSTRRSLLTIDVEDDDGGGGEDASISAYSEGDDAISLGSFSVSAFGIEDEAGGGGSQIKDDLIILGALGQGAGGIVYKAIHKPTMRVVAVKSIPVYDPVKRAQMVKELRALYANMAPIEAAQAPPAEGESGRDAPCPFIVTFHDAYINAEQCSVSMVVEYMDGGSLEDLIDAGGCASEEVLAQICYRILRGFQFIHRQHQIHRDIKPANLLINHRGEVKISDFGIVRELESTQAMASTFVGTMTYMSPERISGHTYTSNCDIWSFGLSIMSLALGSFPLSTTGGYWALLASLSEEPVPSLPADRFSMEFVDFVDRCLERDPRKRPDTAEMLQHPFILRCRDAVDLQMQQGEHVPPTDLENNISEVEEVLEQYCAAMYAEGAAQPGQQLAPEPRKLETLSRQFGVSMDIVCASFARHAHDQRPPPAS